MNLEDNTEEKDWEKEVGREGGEKELWKEEREEEE